MHDWLTFPAGMMAQEVMSKPLVAHVHATGYDRSGGGFLNGNVFRIEKDGLERSDRIIPVGGRVGKTLVSKYGIDHKKINVVYNGTPAKNRQYSLKVAPFKPSSCKKK